MGLNIMPSMSLIYMIFGTVVSNLFILLLSDYLGKSKKLRNLSFDSQQLLLNSGFFVLLLHLLYSIFLTRLGMKSSLRLPAWLDKAIWWESGSLFSSYIFAAPLENPNMVRAIPVEHICNTYEVDGLYAYIMVKMTHQSSSSMMKQTTFNPNVKSIGCIISFSWSQILDQFSWIVYCFAIAIFTLKTGFLWWFLLWILVLC